MADVMGSAEPGTGNIAPIIVPVAPRLDLAPGGIAMAMTESALILRRAREYILQRAIEPLADAVGYRYFYDKQTDQYAHASGIMVLTPDGKVSSYYLGTEYLPKKIQFALMDASDGIIGPLVDQLVLLCFQYDPTVGAYGFYIFNAVRLVGALTVGALVLFWIISWLQERKKPLPPELDIAAPAGIHPGAG